MARRNPGETKCEVPRCQASATCGFYGHEICDRHYEAHCDDESRFDLKVLFGITDEPPKAERRKEWAERLNALEGKAECSPGCPICAATGRAFAHGPVVVQPAGPGGQAQERVQEASDRPGPAEGPGQEQKTGLAALVRAARALKPKPETKERADGREDAGAGAGRDDQPGAGRETQPVGSAGPDLDGGEVA